MKKQCIDFQICQELQKKYSGLLKRAKKLFYSNKILEWGSDTRALRLFHFSRIFFFLLLLSDWDAKSALKNMGKVSGSQKFF